MQLRKIEGTDFKRDKIIFKFQPRNIQVNHFLIQIKVFLFLHEIMQLEEFKSTDFSHDNSIFKFQTKTPQIRHFWSPNSRNFIFVLNIAVGQIWRYWFQIRQQPFQNFSPKYLNKALWFQTEEFSFLHQSLQLDEFEGADFKYDNSFFFLILVQIYPRKYYLS